MTYPDRFSPAVRASMLDRASDQLISPGPVCEVMVACTGAAPVHMHHRRARAMGGTRRPDTNQAGNGLAVCYPCHAWIESNRDHAKAEANGWLVEQSATPALVPVLRRGQRVLLGDDGSVTVLPPTGAWGETPGLGEGLDDEWPLGEYPEVMF